MIDIQFWKDWERLTRSFNEDRNYNEIRKLRIRTENFCDKNGQILEGKEFPKDYLIISEIMHSLFIKWYGPERGGVIKRFKIYLDNGNSNNKKDKTNQKGRRFKGYDKKVNKDYELELNPKFIALFKYIDFHSILKLSKREAEKKLIKSANFEQFSKKKIF